MPEYKIEHRIEHGENRIYGVMNNREVIKIGISSERKPMLMNSICLPSDVKQAYLITECFKAAFDKCVEILINESGIW